MKINKTQLSEIINEEVKKKLRELNIDTYAKAMDTTEMYPWTRMLSGEYENPKHVGLKQQRVNKLARDRFTQEFYKQYPLNSTIIQTSIGPMAFEGIKFNTNYTNYTLMFGDVQSFPSMLFIKYDNQDGYWIDSMDKSIKLDNSSAQLVKDMLKYNIARKQNYNSDSAIRGSIQESLRRAFGLTEVEAVASDGGYYDKPENLIPLTQSEAESIKREVDELYAELFDMSLHDGNALVTNKHDVKKKIIGDMQKHYYINLDYDVGDGGREHVYWIADGQNIEDAKEAFEDIIHSSYGIQTPLRDDSDSSIGESMDDSSTPGVSVPIGLQIAREYGISDYINPDSVVYAGEGEDGDWSVEFSMLIPKSSVYEMKDEREAVEYFKKQFNSKRSSGPGGYFSRSSVDNVESKGDYWFVEVHAYGGYDI